MRFFPLLLLPLPLLIGCPPPGPDAGTPPADGGSSSVRVVSFTASPASVPVGARSTLSWESANATRCTLTPPGDQVVPRSGTLEVEPATTTSFELACDGPGGPATATATVTVAGGARDAGGEPDAGLPDAGVVDAGALDAGANADAGPTEVDADGGPPGPDSGPDSGPGLVDAGAPVDAGVLPAAPIHRWSFRGADPDVVLDRVGDADGQVYDAQFDDQERLRFDGDDDYVDLPNGILSSLSAVTVEVWVEWEGTAVAGNWQRVWDFGTSSVGELVGPSDGGVFYGAETTTHFHLSPQTSYEAMWLKVWSGSEVGSTEVHAPEPLPIGTAVHVVAVYDPVAGRAAIYQDGALLAVDESDDDRMPLSQLDDVNCFVGRSNYSNDASFDGAVDEMRIYDRALSDEEVSLSFARGPDAAF